MVSLLTCSFEKNSMSWSSVYDVGLPSLYLMNSLVWSWSDMLIPSPRSWVLTSWLTSIPFSVKYDYTRYSYHVSSSISMRFFWISLMIWLRMSTSGAIFVNPYSDRLSEIDFLMSFIVSKSATLKKWLNFLTSVLFTICYPYYRFVPGYLTNEM